MDWKKVFLTGHTVLKVLGFLTARSSWCSNGRIFKIYKSQQKDLAGSVETFLADSVVGDICCRKHLTDCLQHWQPDIVFHLAAQPIVRRSFTDVIETFETNLMGTVNLLEAVKQTTSVQAVVIVTSDKCYQNLEKGVPFTEDSPLGGEDPYSASKESRKNE